MYQRNPERLEQILKFSKNEIKNRYFVSIIDKKIVKRRKIPLQMQKALCSGAADSVISIHSGVQQTRPRDIWTIDVRFGLGSAAEPSKLIIMKMTAARTLLRDIRSALLMLVFAPFVLLAGIAPGTMVQAGDAGVQIVLCQGDTLTTVTVDEGHMTETPLHQDAVCAWSGAVSSATLAPSIVMHSDPMWNLVLWDAFDVSVAAVPVSDFTSARAPPPAS